jgi:hypothetical protein
MIPGIYYGKKMKKNLLSLWKNELPAALPTAEEKVCSEMLWDYTRKLGKSLWRSLYVHFGA